MLDGTSDRWHVPLSAAGVHGGNVTLFKDKDLSGVNNSMPLKPSLNRANALKMFQPSTWSGQDRVWKDVLRSENNQVGRGVGYLARVEMWQEFDKVVPYLTGLVLKPGQSASDFKIKVLYSLHLSLFPPSFSLYHIFYSLFPSSFFFPPSPSPLFLMTWNL